MASISCLLCQQGFRQRQPLRTGYATRSRRIMEWTILKRSKSDWSRRTRVSSTMSRWYIFVPDVIRCPKMTPTEKVAVVAELSVGTNFRIWYFFKMILCSACYTLGSFYVSRAWYDFAGGGTRSECEDKVSTRIRFFYNTSWEKNPGHDVAHSWGDKISVKIPKEKTQFFPL